MAIVWLVAAIQLWRHANAFAMTLETLFSPGRPVALFLAWVVLKVLHEIGHGIACRRYGGEVREAGLIFLLLAPVAYVDVTSSWRFRSKWRRIHTAAAGIYVELSIAAVAALLWSWLGPGAFTDILANVVLMAGVTTLAFNLNPLMRFDGYYILADLLEINNLYDMSRRHLRYLAKHHLLGVRVAPVTMPPGRSWVVKVYAVASACWRVVVIVGLLAAAAALFHGAGIVLAAVGVLLWIVAPASRFIVYLVRGTAVEKPRLLRFAAIVAGCLAALAGLLALSPTLPASAPGIVEYSPPVVVRALSPGFVARLHVREGEFVTAGTLLARLANDTLEVELAKLQSSREQAEHRARRFHQRQQMSEYAQECSAIESLAKRLEEKRAQVEALDVVAPASGTVIRRRLATLEGTYLARGDELLTLGNEQSKRVTISLNQNQAEPLMAGSVAAATIFISGQEPWSCALRRLLPGASLTPPDPSLCAPYGEPIAAQRMENNEFQFLAPRFIATVELPPDLSRRLRSGQRCTIVLDQMRIGLAEGLWRWCQSFLKRFHEPDGA